MNNKRKTEYMEKKKEVLIIIPAYNEEKTITALLEPVSYTHLTLPTILRV